MPIAGKGMLLTSMDIEPAHAEEFNRWYDEEHLPRLLEVPGFLSAGRYVAVKGAPKYLAMYELEDHNVLRSTAYLDTVKYQPSPQRTKVGTSRIGRNFLRNLYRQIFPVHTDPIEQTVEMAPFLGSVGVAPRRERRMTFSQSPEYLGDVDLPALRPGATVVLPVNVDGALVSFGDAHGAQGSGEITGAALEIEADVQLTVTAREREVMALVAAGLMNKQIAGEMKLAEITVKLHRGNVMRKMDAKSVADLVRMADMIGIAGKS